jgi:BolA family transcriptional regulator, general stress-responsive regulator
MTRATRIKEKLMVLKPQYFEIIDETPKHAGHLNDDSLETHLVIKISSNSLNDLPRVRQHQTINDLVADEFESGLHALSIKVLKE